MASDPEPSGPHSHAIPGGHPASSSTNGGESDPGRRRPWRTPGFLDSAEVRDQGSATGEPAKKGHGKAGRDLPAAIGVGVGLGAALVLTLGWWPLGFVLLVAVALSVGALELHHALKRLGMRAALVPIVVGIFAIVIGSYFAGQNDRLGIPSNTLMLTTIGITALVTMIWRMPRGEEGYVRDVAASMLIICYLPLQGSFVSLMLADGIGRARVIVFIAIVCLADVGGYVFGVLMGKHKMAPRISPKKTWEGVVGSLVFGVVVAVVGCMWLLHAAWWVGVVLGVVLVCVGICGDLIESLIKRDIGIKDMSSILPGHGGVMDRIDSLLVAAPAAWFLMFLMVPAVPA